jgi:hypothetical protein
MIFELGTSAKLINHSVVDTSIAQSNDNEYASLLNQIRFGIHTPDDIKWQLMYLLQNGLFIKKYNSGF